MIKSKIALILAKIHVEKSKKWKENPVFFQEKLLNSLIQKAINTEFGNTHHFQNIQTYSDFKKQVPIRDYEDFRLWIEEIKSGKKNILWKGKPTYFAKTSGTTSGVKYIPISKESMPFHIEAARSCLFHYIIEKNNADFVDGKMIFVQGNPSLKVENGINIGRLSGIVAHFLPKYLQKNRLPSWETNCIEDWETKIHAIVEETFSKDMRLISGIPPWLIMYFEKLQQKTKQKMGNLFPNLQVLITGGVNFSPYKENINHLIGKNIDIIQTFPASEGFFAFQDTLNSEELLLLINHGIFYEFVPLDEINNENPTRLCLKEVELNKDYALIITTNAGLWAYNIGDTVRFTSLKPYRIIVSGRTQHYTSAFGEHVIAREVETALANTISEFPAFINEFTLAPQVNPENNELPYHEWLIEFEKSPENVTDFAKKLDLEMRELNTYYDDLVTGKIIQPLKISILPKGSFAKYMQAVGKNDPQSKCPRVSNDRKIADVLLG